MKALQLLFKTNDNTAPLIARPMLGIVMFPLTMRGVTKELRLPAKMSKPTKDPWGGVRVGLEARSHLNRKDDGINYHNVLETARWPSVKKLNSKSTLNPLRNHSKSQGGNKR